MRVEVEDDLRAPSPMNMSPTALTNATRRDRLEESPANDTRQSVFLAVEHFLEVGVPTVVENVPGVITVESLDPADEGSFEACKAPLKRRPENSAQVKEAAFQAKQVAMSEPVQTAVKEKSAVDARINFQSVDPADEVSLEGRKARTCPKNCDEVKEVACEVKQAVMSLSVQTSVKEKYVKPAQAKTVFVMQQAQRKGVEMIPDEAQVRGCFRGTRATGDTLAHYANLLYDTFVQECQPTSVKGNDRGDDSVFFRYESGSSTASTDSTSEGSPDGTSMASRNGISRTSPNGSKSKSPSRASSRKLMSDAAVFLSPKSMRYPQAAKVENPVERSERKKNRERANRGRRDSSEKTREDATDTRECPSDLDTMMDKGIEQASLREVRLHMYKAGDSQANVPRAILSGALGALSHQKKTIISLQEKLEDTKLLLQEKENRLSDAETLRRKNEQEIQQQKAKASEDTRALESKIAREAQAKGKLQRRFGILQMEIFRLKAALSEPTDKGAIPSEEDANGIAEVNLRANIVTLKSQLADTQAENTPESRFSSRSSKASATRCSGMHVGPDSADEILHLRERLESAEAELTTLRASKQHGRAAEEKAAMLEQRLAAAEDELLISTQQLEGAKEREATLRKALKVAKERITELEIECAENQESEVAMNQACLSELKLVDELKAEVKRLTETIHEMSQHSVALTVERLKERDRLEEALHRCKNTEHQLRDQILDLEDQLNKAQASTLQLVNVSENVYESRSVKRKLDESFDPETEAIVTRESFQLEECGELKEQLRKSQAAETELRSEMALTRELLHCAEKVVVEMESEMKEESRQRASDESRVANELNELRKKLEASEQKNREIIAAHAKEAEERNKNDDALRQSEAKQQVMLNQIHILKVALESVEIERRHEKTQVAEERRIHEDLETRRIKEIDALRLANVRKAEKSSELEAEVEKLRVRLANMQAESEEMKKNATRQSHKQNEVVKKLETEVSAVKQRLASIRERNAATGQQRKTGSSSNDDFSNSGELVQSFGFSAPSVSSPERRTTISSTESLSTLAVTSRQSSPWTLESTLSSPRKRLGTPELRRFHQRLHDVSTRPPGIFPSLPSKRVDVPSLKQRLTESNERLHDVGTRLTGLAESSDNMAQDLMTLVAKYSDYSDSPGTSENDFQ